MIEKTVDRLSAPLDAHVGPSLPRATRPATSYANCFLSFSGNPNAALSLTAGVPGTPGQEKFHPLFMWLSLNAIRTRVMVDETELPERPKETQHYGPDVVSADEIKKIRSFLVRSRFVLRCRGRKTMLLKLWPITTQEGKE